MCVEKPVAGVHVLTVPFPPLLVLVPLGGCHGWMPWVHACSYAKAITSLKKYPLPLLSGKAATQLEYIGDGTAKKLDKELAKVLAVCAAYC